MKKVMIIDDSLVARKIIKESLSDKNIEIHESIDGYDALEKTSNTKFDLIICDLNMPHLSGIEFIKKFKQTEDSKSQTPIVMMTSDSNIEVIKEAKKLGVIAFLIKPITSDQLSTLIEVI